MNTIQKRMRRATVTDTDPSVDMLQREMQGATIGNTPKPPANGEQWVSPRVLAKRQAIAAWVGHTIYSAN